MNEEYEYEEGMEEVEELDLAVILEAYRKKRLFDMLIGPAISLVFHIIVVILLAIFAVGGTPPKKPEVVVTIVEDKIEELEDEEPEPEEVVEEEVVEEQEVEVDTQVVEVESSIEDVNDEQPETADEMDTSEVLEVEISNSPLKWTFMGGGRSAGGRKRALGKYGGKTGGKSEKAVLRALRWFKYHQSPDGSWPENQRSYRYGMTGLALLCFLAHGETPADSKEFGDTVRKGIDWLLKNTSTKSFASNGYGYAISVYALSEAYGMTQAPKISEAVTRLVRPMIDTQDTTNGWSYRFNKAGTTDMSLSGWVIQALKAAYASGIEAKGLTECLERALKLCDNAINFKTGVGYYHPRSKQAARLSMGAAASLCMQLMGENQHAKVVSVYNRIMDEFKKDTKGIFAWNGKTAVRRTAHHNYIGYDWYYQTQVVFQKMKKKAWKKWNSEFLYKQITLHQETEVASIDHNGVKKGTKLGYWRWPDPKHGAANTNWERYYSTALSCLQLEVFYRLLPGTGKRPGEGHGHASDDKDKKKNTFDEEDSDELKF